jgi:hypothetical protein
VVVPEILRFALDDNGGEKYFILISLRN